MTSSPETAALDAARHALDELPGDARPGDIFRILQRFVPVTTGYFEGFSLSSPNDPSMASFEDNEEMVATVLTTRDTDDKSSLHFVAQAQPGELIAEEVIPDDDWRSVGGYHAMRDRSAGLLGALKLAQQAVNGGMEHQYIALCLAPGLARWTAEHRAILRALHEPLQRAFARLTLPLLRRETVLVQVADEQQLGLVVLNESGLPQEANRRGWLLALEASRARNRRRPDVLTAFVEQVMRLPYHPDTRRRLLSLSPSGDRLEVWTHHLASGPHHLPAPRTLLVLRKESLIAPEWPSLAARLTEQQRRIAEALAVPGASPSTVAAERGLSLRTVEKHLERIYGELSINSRAELIALLRGR